MAPSQPALQLARRLTALPEPVMRERVLLEYLHEADLDQAVRVLDEIYRLGREGGPPFNIALLTLASLLSHGAVSYELTAELYQQAKEADLESVTLLLYSSQPSSVTFTRREEQLELTLGHRKWMARSTDRDVLHRLLANPEPEVINNLLDNPRITERDVVRLAARRPAFSEVQFEVFASPRWIRRYNVKRALVLNPYTPTELTFRLVGFLNRRDLRLVISSPGLPESLRDIASHLLTPQEKSDEGG